MSSFLVQKVQSISGVHPPSYSMGIGDFSPGAKWPDCDAGHTCPPGSEVYAQGQHLARRWVLFENVGEQRVVVGLEVWSEIFSAGRPICLEVKQIKVVGLHDMKAYGRMKIWVKPFLTSELDWGEWSASRAGRFTP